MATNKIQTGIRFQPELLYKISYVAKENKRSLNAQLEYLAQLCVREFEAQNGEIPLDEDAIYRPSAWAAFGMDKEGADYRACANFGPAYK